MKTLIARYDQNYWISCTCGWVPLTAYRKQRLAPPPVEDLHPRAAVRTIITSGVRLSAIDLVHLVDPRWDLPFPPDECSWFDWARYSRQFGNLSDLEIEAVCIRRAGL